MMIKHFTFLFLFFLSVSSIAQVINNQEGYSSQFQENSRDSTKLSLDELNIQLSEKAYYTDYKIIDQKFDTTFVDTSLTIMNDYKLNYLMRDNLELMPFANQGQTFSNLAYTFDNTLLYPQIGARGSHFNYMEVKDVKYYHVATPTTVLFYRTGLEQGQTLDALFTFNTSKRFNASIAHQGLRSLGNYRHALSKHAKTRVTINYQTEKGRYHIRAHLVAQDLDNEQNGGLTQESKEYFESGDGNFKDRARLETNYTNADNVVHGNRYYFDHFYKIWGKKDSTRIVDSDLRIGHAFNYEVKHYEFNQSAPHLLYGGSFSSAIKDRLNYTKLYNEAYLSLTSPITLGEVKFKVNYFDYNYRYSSIVIKPDDIIVSHLKGNNIAVGGEWHTRLKKFNFDADASTIISGELHGFNFTAAAQYAIDSSFVLRAKGFTASKSPNFNFLLFQSSYKNFNWQNDYKNEQTNNLTVEIDSKKWIYASLQTTNILNYTYFDAPIIGEQTRPVQATEAVNYLKLTLSKEIKFGNFALDNQFIYQKVASGGDIFRVPDFITRNTLYYANHLFKGNSLYLQTGVTFSYFSKYYMNSYNPVISEFNIQNNEEIGGYPLFDFFINAKIRTFRVFLKFQHFNAHLGKYDYYSAPSQPYLDFKIRLGLIWTFFI